MPFDERHAAWLAAEQAARAANDQIFRRMHGAPAGFTEGAAGMLAMLRGDACAQPQCMLEAANDRHTV